MATTIIGPNIFVNDNQTLLFPQWGLNGTPIGQIIWVGNATPVTVNANVTTDQNLMTYTIPAGGMNIAGRILRVHAWGVFSTQATAPNIQFKMKLGGITPITFSVLPSTGSIANNWWRMEFELATVTTGASGTLEAHGTFGITVGQTGQMISAIGPIAPTGIPATVAANTSVDTALTVVTGITATDRLISVTKNADQAGLLTLPGPGLNGGVTGTSAVTIRYVNCTVAAITPTAAEAYTFNVARTIPITVGDTNTAVTAAIDLTAAQAIQLTGAFISNASTSNSITQRLMVVEIIN